MTNVIILMINIYQKIISAVLLNLGIKSPGGNCRFSPTCSEYAKQIIAKHGILRGSYLSTVRLLKCQPFYKGK